MKKTKIQKSKFLRLVYQLQNYWKLGWLDNKARYAKTYLGEVWIALSVILLSTFLGIVYGDIFGSTIDGDIKYFSYLALGITLWNCIADSMALGSRFIIESAPQILNTNFSLKSLFLRKFFYICQNLVIGLSSILFVILFVNKELIGNYKDFFGRINVSIRISSYTVPILIKYIKGVNHYNNYELKLSIIIIYLFL